MSLAIQSVHSRADMTILRRRSVPLTWSYHQATAPLLPQPSEAIFVAPEKRIAAL